VALDREKAALWAAFIIYILDLHDQVQMKLKFLSQK